MRLIICGEAKEKLIVTNNYSEIKKSTYNLTWCWSISILHLGVKANLCSSSSGEKVLNDKTPFLGICVGMQIATLVTKMEFFQVLIG